MNRKYKIFGLIPFQIIVLQIFFMLIVQVKWISADLSSHDSYNEQMKQAKAKLLKMIQKGKKKLIYYKKEIIFISFVNSIFTIV